MDLDKPTRRQASTCASRHSDKPTSQQANTPASQDSDNLTSQYAHKPTSRQVDKQTIRQAGKQIQSESALPFTSRQIPKRCIQCWLCSSPFRDFLLPLRASRADTPSFLSKCSHLGDGRSSSFSQSFCAACAVVAARLASVEESGR